MKNKNVAHENECRSSAITTEPQKQTEKLFNTQGNKHRTCRKQNPESRTEDTTRGNAENTTNTQQQQQVRPKGNETNILDLEVRNTKEEIELAPTRIFNTKTLLLFIKWVLISTGILCIYIHHNANSLMLPPTSYPPSYHSPMALPTIYPLSCYLSSPLQTISPHYCYQSIPNHSFKYHFSILTYTMHPLNFHQRLLPQYIDTPRAITRPLSSTSYKQHLPR